MLLKYCIDKEHYFFNRDIGEPSDLNNFNDLWIVQKYHGHDLKTVIRNYQLYGMTPEKIRHIIYQIVCSLKYLHVFINIYPYIVNEDSSS